MDAKLSREGSRQQSVGRRSDGSNNRPRLSVVIPAYNEVGRLPPVLAEAQRYLDAQFHYGYEVVVVDDGSSDSLLDLLESLSANWPNLSVIRHLSNLGKGAAVKSGMQAARGEVLLFMDADGATPIGEEAALRKAIESGADVAIGSRVLPSHEVKRTRTMNRQLVGWLFSLICRVALRVPMSDTQCGFKMFRRQVGQHLFAELREAGFAFDLELLASAAAANYRIVEVPVAWQEVPGSKVRIVRDSVRMLRSLFAIRRRLRRNAAQSVLVTPARKTVAMGDGAVK